MRGALLVLGAYVFWGLSPLFWRLLADVPPIEQLAHRVLWALPLLVAAAWMTRGYRNLRGIGVRGWGRIGLSAVALGLNWGTFVYAISVERVVEASLGYYMNPLVSVLLGVVVLGERLRRAQWLAVGLAAGGVVFLTVALGSLPWISLVLAFSFGLYGLAQKRYGAIGPWTSLGSEIIWMLPAALIGVFVWAGDGSGSFGVDPGLTWLLLATGPVTIIPLLLFGAGARKIPLTMVGLFQYVAPTLQLLVGVAIFGEPFPTGRLIGFLIVWAGVAVYVWDLWSTREPVPARQ